MDIKQLEHLIRSQNMCVLQDTRIEAGNAMVFHARDHKGHTSDLSKAHLFTLKAANLRKAERPTDQVHRLGDLIMAAGLSVDVARFPPQQNARTTAELDLGEDEGECVGPGPS